MDALVCWVEAETCSADAEDCSATAATSLMLVSIWVVSAEICSAAPAISVMRRGHVLDGVADALERLAGLLDGRDAVLGALGAVGDDG